MADPLHTVAATLREAFARATGLPADDIDPVVRPSDRADAQANGALALAKQLGKNPREVAEAVVATGLLVDVCSDVEVAGPGFINLTFTPQFLAEQLAAAIRPELHRPRSVRLQKRPALSVSHGRTRLSLPRQRRSKKSRPAQPAISQAGHSPRLHLHAAQQCLGAMRRRRLSAKKRHR